MYGGGLAIGESPLGVVGLPPFYQLACPHFIINHIILEVYVVHGPYLLAGGPLGLLTSSLVPFGRSGRVTRAIVIG